MHVHMNVKFSSFLLNKNKLFLSKYIGNILKEKSSNNYLRRSFNVFLYFGSYIKLSTL
jgi:hypothetical protein